MRILIADDHELLRDTLTLYLEAEGGIEVSAVADLDAAVAAIRAEPCGFDLVLLDFTMPGMFGLEGLRTVIDLPGHRRVALISGTASREIAVRALADGAAGFLPKSLPARSLINAARFMAMGERYVPPDFMRDDDKADHPLAKELSRREFEVLRGLTEGKSNKEIARDLDIREPTVKLHVKTLYRKVGALNRTQAAMIAKEKGLV